MSFRIVTDSASNITDKVVERYGIKVIPLTYIVGDKEFKMTESESFDYELYYEDIARGMAVSTSQISPQEYIDAFEPILKRGDDILFIGLSSGLSGSYNGAKFAAKELMDDYPERDIRVVDSLGAALGYGILVAEAAECCEMGMSLDETEEYINFEKFKMYQVFIVDDLKYLKKTGRVSGPLATLGSMLDIKPVLKGDTEGKIVVDCKARGRRQAIKALAQKYKNLAVDPENQIVGITYGGKREDAVHLANLICRICEPRKIWMVPHEPATGAHTGPGVLALFFKGRDDVRAF